MNKRNTYLKPEVMILHLDCQSVLASSNPSITNPPMPWEPSSSSLTSNSSELWTTQKKNSPWMEE